MSITVSSEGLKSRQSTTHEHGEDTQQEITPEEESSTQKEATNTATEEEMEHKDAPGTLGDDQKYDRRLIHMMRKFL